MYPPNQADEQTGGASEHYVEQQQSLQFVPFELPLPGADAGRDRRQHKSSSGDEIETGRCRQSCALRQAFRRVCRGFSSPSGREIERDSRQKKCNGKVDQDDMLCMFREQRRLGIKGIHEATYSTTNLPVIFG